LDLTVNGSASCAWWDPMGGARFSAAIERPLDWAHTLNQFRSEAQRREFVDLFHQGLAVPRRLLG
jgi:hypothetical protein